MKTIHILPTDKPTRLHNKNGDLGNYPSTKLYIEDFKGNQHNSFHIYITSYEEIKEGVNQWYLDKFLNKPRNSSGSQYGEKQDVIILTTDPDLINDGVQAIDDEFLEWFVNNASCEKVRVEESTLLNTSRTYLGVEHYKIIIPKEEPKYPIGGYAPGNYMCYCATCKIEFMGDKYACQCEPCAIEMTKEEPKQDLEKEMFELEQELDIPSHLRWHNSKPKQEALEEAAERIAMTKDWDFESSEGNGYYDYVEGFIEGAKWQAEKMYSEEEVIAICRAFATFVMRKGPSYKKQQEWFEQFKKK